MSPLSPIAKSWLATFDARWPHARRRAGPIALTALIEIVLLWVLLSLGAGSGGQGRDLGEILTTFEAARSDAPEADRPAPEPAEAKPAAAAPAQQSPAAPATAPDARPSPPPIALPRAPTAPPAEPPAPPATSPTPNPPKIRAVVRSDMTGNGGPVDTRGGGGGGGDSQRIAGSGPNGEPLYAAQWYREPTDDEYRGYFSRVDGSAWALINCRTVPGFRVEDCVLVDHWPDHSGVGSAVMAMAWQFRVRPPRIGGRSMVGEWVRIRIDYVVTRR